MLNAYSIFNVIGLIAIITIIIFNIYRNDLYNVLELFYASDSILPYVFSIINHFYINHTSAQSSRDNNVIPLYFSPKQRRCGGKSRDFSNVLTTFSIDTRENGIYVFCYEQKILLWP